MDGSSNGAGQLLLYSQSQHGQDTDLYYNINDFSYLHSKNNDGRDNIQTVFYDVLDSAGVTSTNGYNVAGAGAQATLAIKNATGGSIQPISTTAVESTLFAGTERHITYDWNAHVGTTYSTDFAASTDT